MVVTEDHSTFEVSAYNPSTCSFHSLRVPTSEAHKLARTSDASKAAEYLAKAVELDSAGTSLYVAAGVFRLWSYDVMRLFVA